MEKFNAAQQIIIAVFGLPIQNILAHHVEKMERCTKKGPGRVHKQGDGLRTANQLKAGAYGRGLQSHFTALRNLRAGRAPA